MIVDCHTHINCAAGEVGTFEHLAAAETVDVCVVLATMNEPSEEVNKKLAQYVTKHKEKMVGFALIEPVKDKISVNNIKNLTDKLGLKGVVLYNSVCGFHPTHSRAMRFYESAQELGLPVFFHNSDVTLGANAILEYAQPYLLDEVARTFPALRIIVGNMGLPFIEQTLSMVSKHENVYADLTIQPSSVWQTYNIVIAAHERAVMNKLLFGSGFPSGNAGQCMETLLSFNMLLADTNLPTVPRGSIRNIIERDTLGLIGIEHKSPETQEEKDQTIKVRKSTSANSEDENIDSND